MQNNHVNLFSLEHTVMKNSFDDTVYPYEVIPKIKELIMTVGEMLPKDKYDEKKKGVWIAKSANISESAYISAPCIIDEGAEVRHCAYIRGSVVVGKNCVVGNSTELKNVILFDNVQVPHYNYVGDSILGYKAHMGASSITSNVKMDKSPVVTDYGDGKIETGLKKLGAIIGDNVEIGCGAVLNPGTVIGRGARVYPLCSVRGYVKEESLYKSSGEIIDIARR